MIYDRRKRIRKPQNSNYKKATKLIAPNEYKKSIASQKSSEPTTNENDMFFCF